MSNIPMPFEHPYTHMLKWFTSRKLKSIKVVNINLHECCWCIVLAAYLLRFESHVRHIYSRENIRNRYRGEPCQSALIARYCHNLTSFFVCTYLAKDASIFQILTNNPRLEKLHIDGELYGANCPARNPPLALHHLKQLAWHSSGGFSATLTALAKAAPNIQQLSLSNCSEIADALILDVARACPNLRAFGCSELYIGRNDCALKPFLSICNKIVNLDLGMHHKITDTDLIEALSELNGLKRLNLRGCCRLTDITLLFLAQRFATTLNELHLDHNRGYTAAGVASLRAQCTQLHTFHYNVYVVDERVNGEVLTLSLDAYQSATIVHMGTRYEDFLPMILEHCQQMQILIVSCDKNGQKLWLTEEQLTAVATLCPQLRMVVRENNIYCKVKYEVDYSAVKKAFPKQQFVEDMSVLDFDILTMPV